jgi:hypothetical protein
MADIRFGMTFWGWGKDRQKQEGPVVRRDNQPAYKRLIDTVIENGAMGSQSCNYSPAFGKPNPNIWDLKPHEAKAAQKALKLLTPKQYGIEFDKFAQAHPQVMNKDRLIKRIEFLENRLFNDHNDYWTKK